MRYCEKNLWCEFCDEILWYQFYVGIFMTSRMFRWDVYFGMIEKWEKYWFYWEYWDFDGWKFDWWNGILGEFLPYYIGDIGWVRKKLDFIRDFWWLGCKNGVFLTVLNCQKI